MDVSLFWPLIMCLIGLFNTLAGLSGISSHVNSGHSGLTPDEDGSFLTTFSKLSHPRNVCLFNKARKGRYFLSLLTKLTTDGWIHPSIHTCNFLPFEPCGAGPITHTLTLSENVWVSNGDSHDPSKKNVNVLYQRTDRVANERTEPRKERERKKPFTTFSHIITTSISSSCDQPKWGRLTPHT